MNTAVPVINLVAIAIMTKKGIEIDFIVLIGVLFDSIVHSTKNTIRMPSNIAVTLGGIEAVNETIIYSSAKIIITMMNNTTH